MHSSHPEWQTHIFVNKLHHLIYWTHVPVGFNELKKSMWEIKSYQIVSGSLFDYSLMILFVSKDFVYIIYKPFYLNGAYILQTTTVM